jgi:hypothetical protein
VKRLRFVVLWFARAGHALYQPLVRPWYRTKRQPSFADMLTTLRRESLRAWVSAHPAASNLPQNLLGSLLEMPARTG